MKEEKDKTLDLIERLQQGDDRAREELISNYRGFIVKMAGKYTFEDRDVYHSDAYSIALIAFNEAADKYSKDKGSSFKSFAGQIIKNRLIDLIRSNSKYAPEFVTSEVPENSYEEEDLEGIKEEMSSEIQLFEKKLAEFNITLEDLVKETPKHKDTRCRAIEMAQEVISDQMLLEHFYKKKSLPFKKLLLRFKCNPKTIQRHRKYIVAICIALSSSQFYLKDYVLRVAKGCDENDT